MSAGSTTGTAARARAGPGEREPSWPAAVHAAVVSAGLAPRATRRSTSRAAAPSAHLRARVVARGRSAAAPTLLTPLAAHLESLSAS